MTHKRRLTLIELNEANLELFDFFAQRYKSCQQVSRMARTETLTQDTYESDYLEPWVQWVSVHTGQPSAVHQIKHLGDLPRPSVPQLWETLGSADVSTGIWGVMNGARREAKNCQFFVADPWIFEEAPYPAKLTKMVSLAQYIARNYCRLQPLAFLRYGFEYLSGLFENCSLAHMLHATRILMRGVMQFGPKHFVLGAFFEYLSAIAFLKNKRDFDPNFSILFLNLIAHTQHHHWKNSKTGSPELTYCYSVIDDIFREIIASSAEDEVLLFGNALSQNNTNNERPWIQYRQKDQTDFLKDCGFTFNRVESLMTHDAHIFFANESDRDRAFDLLTNSTVLSQPLFFVEKDASNSCKLFYRLQFTDALSFEDVFIMDGVERRFLEHFDIIVTRTGKHDPHGFVFQSKTILPQQMPNHELYRYICDYFELSPLDTTESKVPANQIC